MYRKFLVTFLLCPAAALASAMCATDSLANYELLTPAGCTVKGLPFSGFSFSTLFTFGGAIAVNPSQITVTPVDPDIAAGLNFASSGFGVDPGQAVQYRLSFAVDDPPIIHGWDLQLFDPVLAPAFLTISSEECLGAAFVGSVCPTSLTVTNTVSDNGIVAVRDDTKFFAPVRVVGELTTITLDARTGGSASFTSVSEFALLTPEPWPAMLTSSGLIWLIFARRLRR